MIDRNYPPIIEEDGGNGYPIYDTALIKCDCDSPDSGACRNRCAGQGECRCICHHFA